MMLKSIKKVCIDNKICFTFTFAKKYIMRIEIEKILQKAKRYSGCKDLKIYEIIKSELIQLSLTPSDYDYYIGLIINILEV